MFNDESIFASEKLTCEIEKRKNSILKDALKLKGKRNRKSLDKKISNIYEKYKFSPIILKGELLEKRKIQIVEEIKAAARKQ